MEVRYMGFEQLRNARAFRFDVMAKGEATKAAVVTADIALFLRFHVALQEGPTLCAGKLKADLANNVDGEHVLTADDLSLFSAGRAAAEEKRLESRRGGRRNSTGTPFVPNALERP